MTFVGMFDEQELNEGKDKIEAAKKSQETGEKFHKTKIVKKNSKMFLKVWVCSLAEWASAWPRRKVY